MCLLFPKCFIIFFRSLDLIILEGTEPSIDFEFKGEKFCWIPSQQLVSQSCMKSWQNWFLKAFWQPSSRALSIFCGSKLDFEFGKCLCQMIIIGKSTPIDILQVCFGQLDVWFLNVKNHFIHKIGFKMDDIGTTLFCRLPVNPTSKSFAIKM